MIKKKIKIKKIIIKRRKSQEKLRSKVLNQTRPYLRFSHRNHRHRRRWRPCCRGGWGWGGGGGRRRRGSRWRGGWCWARRWRRWRRWRSRRCRRRGTGWRGGGEWEGGASPRGWAARRWTPLWPPRFRLAWWVWTVPPPPPPLRGCRAADRGAGLLLPWLFDWEDGGERKRCELVSGEKEEKWWGYKTKSWDAFWFSFLWVGSKETLNLNVRSSFLRFTGPG